APSRSTPCARRWTVRFTRHFTRRAWRSTTGSTDGLRRSQVLQVRVVRIVAKRDLAESAGLLAASVGGGLVLPPDRVHDALSFLQRRRVDRRSGQIAGDGLAIFENVVVAHLTD